MTRNHSHGLCCLHLCCQPCADPARRGLAGGWPAAEELLIVGANLDAAKKLAREIAKRKGAAFELSKLRARCTAT